jgi:hypothetical protein
VVNVDRYCSRTRYKISDSIYTTMWTLAYTKSTFQSGGDTGGGASTGGSKNPLQGGTVSMRSDIPSVVSIPTELHWTNMKTKLTAWRS